MPQRTKLATLVIILALVFFGAAARPAQAQTPVVQTILFFSPTCPHCHEVMTNTLPPLVDQYGSRLQILSVDVTIPVGQALYQEAILAYQIPESRRGVPTMILGTTVLVGGFEVPEYLPTLIEQGLAAGGIYWPLLPGLAEALEAGTFEFFGGDPNTANTLTAWERFNLDPAGNSLAVAVLAGMIFSVFQLWRIYTQGKKNGAPETPPWAIPLFVIIGLASAGYLSYVELTKVEAICGPVGDCNAVQESEYARLFGLIPIGILGIAGYLALLASWAVHRFGAETLRGQARQFMWWIAIAGTVFSIYLTFLEPFVIGATCAWCVTSAIAMTILLWLTTFEVVREMHSARRIRRAR